MVILCLGSVVVLAAGNVQSLLLMSGRSSWAAINKVVVLSFNVVGNLVVIPVFGITGAAAIWAASMVLDTILAAWQAHRATEVALPLRSVLRTGLLVTLSVVVPAGSVALVFGQGTGQMMLAVVLCALSVTALCYLDRERLHLHELRALRGGRHSVT